MPLRGLGALSGGALAAWHAVTRLGPESQRSGSRGPVPATRSIHVDGSADRQTRPRDVGHDRFTRGGRVDAFHRADERHQRAHQVRWRADRHGARGVLCLPPMRRKPRHARQSHRRRVRCLLPRFDGAILLRDGTVATSDSVVTAAPRPRRPSLLHCRDRWLRARNRFGLGINKVGRAVTKADGGRGSDGRPEDAANPADRRRGCRRH